MAKIDRLQNLINGLSPAPGQPPESETNSIDELALNPEQAAKLQELRTRKRGRPRDGQHRPPVERATFLVSRDITRKLKYIALADTKLYKTVVCEALTSYIDTWESENGTITI